MKSDLVLICLLVLLFISYTSTKGVLRKCCPKDQYFQTQDMYFKCAPKEQLHVNVTSELWWIPQPDNERIFTIASGHIDYGFPRCSDFSNDLFYEKDFHVHLTGGKVRLEVLKESSLHDVDKKHSQHFASESYCLDAASDGRHIAMLCPCGEMTCARKCCMDMYAYDAATGKCEDVADREEMADWSPGIRKDTKGAVEYYRLTSKIRLPCKSYKTHVMNFSEDAQLFLLQNGDIQDDITNQTYARNTYCGDFTTNNTEVLLYCPPEPEASGKSAIFLLYGVLFIIGAVALLLVVLLALCFPQLRRNIHGKMALAHNAMLLVGYVTMGVTLLRGNESHMNVGECKIISFIIQFTILSAFFWLNIMCIDIAWAFSGLRPIQGSSAVQRDRKKFALYSLYAWGTTGLITAVTAIVEFSPSAVLFKPNFGVKSCFFNDGGAMLLFFYGPMAILLLMNIALFAYTAAKIIAIKRQTAILHTSDSSTNKKNKQRLILYVKLFSIMGVTWVFEVMSWAVGGSGFYWVLTDVINLLRGVFIFVLFCCKQTVYNLVKDRALRLCGKEGLELTSSLREQRSMQTTSSVCKDVVTPEGKRKHEHKKQQSNLRLMPTKK